MLFLRAYIKMNFEVAVQPTPGCGSSVGIMSGHVKIPRYPSLKLSGFCVILHATATLPNGYLQSYLV